MSTATFDMPMLFQHQNSFYALTDPKQANWLVQSENGLVSLCEKHCIRMHAETNAVLVEALQNAPKVHFLHTMP